MNVTWNAHPDGAIFSQIDQLQTGGDFDLCKSAAAEFVLTNGEGANYAVTLITQRRLKEADFQRIPEIEHSEPMGGDTAARIAELARRLSVS